MAIAHDERGPDAFLRGPRMNQDRIERECRTFVHYLIGRDPEPYVIAKYVDYHSQHGARVAPADPFERFLLDISVCGSFWTRLADTYASRFHKHASLRKKLVLTLALLECSPASFDTLDRATARGVVSACARLAWSVTAYVTSLLAALLLFLPVRMWKSAMARDGKIPATES